MVMLTHLLCPDRPINLPLVMLASLAEHRQQHDRAIGPAPIRYPDRYLAKPDPKFPYRALQMIRPWPAEPSAFLREHATQLVDPFEVAAAETL
jgi:hypothetical protein